MTSIEKVQQEVTELHKLVKQQGELIKLLQSENKRLREQLGQNSRNSSWPPSQDKGQKKKKTKSLRRPTGRRAGGQKGHQGKTLEMVAEPDVIVKHRPSHCQYCAAAFNAEQEAVEVGKRQVLDLPPLQFVTTEHQTESMHCSGCGKISQGAFPAGVTHRVQYGTGVKRLATYLRSEQFLPVERSRQLLQDLFGFSLSPGSLLNFYDHAARKAEWVTETIKGALIQQPVAHADETGCQINGECHWLHSFSTANLSYFSIQRRRGKVAIDDIGLVPAFRGTLVHDGWNSYFHYPLLENALCNVHLLRNLNGVIENDDQNWSRLMRHFLLAAKAQVEVARDAGKTQLPRAYLDRIDQLYATIVAIGIDENPLPQLDIPRKRGRPKKSNARNLLDRFVKHKLAILRFIHDFNVPFDNNLAERDIRMMKLQQKISGCFRSPRGAEQFATLRSYTSTIRKQGLNVWHALGSLYSDTPLFPDLTPV